MYVLGTGTATAAKSEEPAFCHHSSGRKGKSRTVKQQDEVSSGSSVQVKEGLACAYFAFCPLDTTTSPFLHTQRVVDPKQKKAQEIIDPLGLAWRFLATDEDRSLLLNKRQKH